MAQGVPERPVLPYHDSDMSVFSKVLKIGEGKRLKELQQLADGVNGLESTIEPLTDAELAAKTDEFRARLADGATLDEIECEAYAVVREAARRVLGQRPFDVQLVGAGALHRHMIAEMKTGEGKTLVSALPSYLNALSGKGVHLVTVNDYLASRDAEWMGSIHRFLGLTVGLIQSEMTPQDRRPQYAKDITYGTNNEFGFDYLRDNMAMRPDRPCAARPRVCHRGRGRLDPRRRGPHAAHHLRASRGDCQVLPRLRQDRATPAAGRPLRG